MINIEMVKKQFLLKSRYENVSKTCMQIREVCNREINNEEICNGIEISLTEALNNVIEHAYEENPDEVIIVTMECSDKLVEFKIIDTGKPRTNFDSPSIEFDPDDIESLPEGGMGLYIIESIMDETDYRSEEGKNIFHLIKRF